MPCGEGPGAVSKQRGGKKGFCNMSSQKHLRRQHTSVSFQPANSLTKKVHDDQTLAYL